MASGIRRALGQVECVEVGLLRYASPFGIEQDQRGKAVWIGSFEYPRCNPRMSVGARLRTHTHMHTRSPIQPSGDENNTYCVMISSGSLSKAEGIASRSGIVMGRFSMEERRPSSALTVSISGGLGAASLALSGEHRDVGKGGYRDSRSMELNVVMVHDVCFARSPFLPL